MNKVMNQYLILLRKELLEAARSYKLLWMPLVFLALGISDPLVNYYMDEILASVGNLPEGFELVMPELAPADLLRASTGQFQLIGLAVLTAVTAGAVSRERQNGTAVMIYTRPLQFAAYFLSKYTGVLLIGALCVLLGYGGSIYYTSILYGEIPLLDALYMLGGYLLWLSFVLAFALCMSAAFSTGAATAMSLIVIVAGGLIDTAIGSFWTYSPYKLGEYSVDFVALGAANEHFAVTACITLLLALLCILLGFTASSANRKKVKV